MSTAKYPTLQEVKTASVQQLEAWWHDLPTPQNDEQREILHQIIEAKLDLSEALEAAGNTARGE